MMALTGSFVFFGGMAVGSFVSVVAHRVPRRLPVGMDRSRCPSCENQIAAYDNIPVLSWLLLHGRCRSCGTRIPARYPLLELGLGVAFLITFLVLRDDTGQLALGLIFVATLAAITITDLELRLIPNRILLVSAIAGIALAAIVDPASLPERGLAAVGASGLLLVTALAYPKGMGMGDVKLAGVMGIYLGSAVIPALLIGFLSGAVVGLGVIAAEGAEARKKGIPFGPFLALGGFVALLAGDQLIHWYLSTFLGR
jgi:leader peptidase (prepilin peptidase)/N-methyltransferase